MNKYIQHPPTSINEPIAIGIAAIILIAIWAIIMITLKIKNDE